MRKLALLAAAVAVILAVALPLSFRFLGGDEGASAEAPLVMGIDPETTGNTCGSSPADCTLGTVESCVRVDVPSPSFDGASDYVIDVYIDDPAGSAPAAQAYDAWLYYDQNIVHMADPGTDGKIRMPGADLPGGDEFALPDSDGRFDGGWMFLVGTPQPGVNTYIGDGPLLRLGLDIGASGLVIFSLHEVGSSYSSSGPTAHRLTFHTAQLAINQDCPRAPPAPPAGPSPTPVEPEPTSDLRLEWERARQEEEAKPRFEGMVNGIRLYSLDAEAAAQRKDACSDAAPEEVEHVTMSAVAGTPMEIVPTYLPPGADETPPMWQPVICKGIVAYVERQWLIRDRDANFFVIRRQGEQATDIDASADRVSPATVGGKRAVLVEPLTPEGYGYSMAIVAEDFGITSVVAFGLPIEETVKIAEGLK